MTVYGFNYALFGENSVSFEEIFNEIGSHKRKTEDCDIDTSALERNLQDKGGHERGAEVLG